MADAQASGACGRKIVWVQVPSPAFFFCLKFYLTMLYSYSTICSCIFSTNFIKKINPSHFARFLFPLPSRPPATLPTIKSGEIEIETKNSSKGRTACDYPLYLSRLKNFVKISDYTRFCVDTENAAV